MTTEAARVREATREIAEGPYFPECPPGRWAETERETQWVLDHLPGLVSSHEDSETCFRYAQALYDRGDECGAEEIWEALHHGGAFDEDHALAACTAARLARCALDAQELRAGFEWCHRGRHSAKGLPPGHPLHAALSREEGFIHTRRGNWASARRCLASASACVSLTAEDNVAWEREAGADVQGRLFLALADLALEQVRTESPAAPCDLTREARAWLSAARSVGPSPLLLGLVEAAEAEADCFGGEGDRAQRRLSALGGPAEREDRPSPALHSRLLRVGAWLALEEGGTLDAQRLICAAYERLQAARHPLREWLVVQDAVRIFARIHELRYGTHRENTVLRAFEEEGSWLLDMVRLADSRDLRMGRRHAATVRDICLALAVPPVGAPPAYAEDVDIPCLHGAALLHDLGKLEVPWPLLNRIRPHGPREVRRFRAHVLAGVRILESLGLPMAARLIEEHHERADGHGYPYGTNYQSTAGGFLALAEEIAPTDLPVGRTCGPASLAEVSRWCFTEGASRFQPHALAALRGALDNGALAFLDTAPRA